MRAAALRTAADFRLEATSLRWSYRATNEAGYARAAGRCERVANLLDRGRTLDEATAIVLGFGLAR